MRRALLLLLANVVHTDLNYRGGSERLAIATILALSNMGINVELTLLKRPNLLQLEKTYGETATLILKKIRTINILQPHTKSYTKKDYDLTINTAGDLFPFFRSDFTMNNSIVYCHFPLAKYKIESRDPRYIQFLNNINKLPTVKTTISHNQDNLKAVSDIFSNMMINSSVLTNSQYSRKAILKAFGVDSKVLSPPVDVDLFRRNSLYSNNRKDIILVISRFHPTKKLENAIRLARLLKQNGIGSHMKIIGILAYDCLDYYSYLKNMVEKYKLTDYVIFETNVRFSRLLKAMHEAMVYFHPLAGEPFGISTVEAMSAGLIPVVPDIGGHTEFVPLKYQFHTCREGVKAIASALNASSSERISISDSVRKYSVRNYVKHFQQIVKMLLYNARIG
jgi:glycosyltransferase involved in cell wall biosynthesis